MFAWRLWLFAFAVTGRTGHHGLHGAKHGTRCLTHAAFAFTVATGLEFGAWFGTVTFTDRARTCALDVYGFL